MGRPNRSAERRSDLIRTVAAAFAELGYRRTTTTVLAERCGLPEQALYRLWPDKRAMFVAAIEFVGEHSEQVWRRVLGEPGSGSGAERVIAHESKHLGEVGFYRILFAGFSETDDPVIAGALQKMYGKLLRFMGTTIDEHRGGKRKADLPPAMSTAWALVGLATATNLGRELGLLGARARQQLFEAVGRHLLG